MPFYPVNLMNILLNRLFFTMFPCPFLNIFLNGRGELNVIGKLSVGGIAVDWVAWFGVCQLFDLQFCSSSLFYWW